jgi:hypothetical protein
LLRQQLIRNIIDDGIDYFEDTTGIKCELLPLSDLLEYLMTDTRQLIGFLLAPLTGLFNLFQLDTSGILYRRLVKLFGQLFAWDNYAPRFWTKSKTTLNILKNQFNVDCDTDVIEYIFSELRKCTALTGIFLVPTEILKADDLLKFHDDMYNLLKKEDFNSLPLLSRGWCQWNLVKNDKPQIIFDPAVIFLAFNIVDMEMKRVSIVAHEPLVDQEGKKEWDRPIYVMYEDDTSKLPLFAGWDFANIDTYKSALCELLEENTYKSAP